MEMKTLCELHVFLTFQSQALERIAQRADQQASKQASSRPAG